MNKLYYLIGIPGAGKTTWAKNFCKDTNAIHCEADEIRFKMYKEYDKSKSKQVYEILDKKVIDLLSSGYDVIYDTMGAYEYRATQLKKFMPYADCIAVYFPVPLEYAISNNKRRERCIPEETIRLAYKNTVVPTKEEGFKEIIVINL